MEDELRLFLLLGGTVFIIGVLAHGIWKIRKNSKPEEKTRLEPRQWEEDEDAFDDDEQQTSGFDELGIGAVRVVGKSTQNEMDQTPAEKEITDSKTSFEDDEEPAAVSSSPVTQATHEDVNRDDNGATTTERLNTSDADSNVSAPEQAPVKVSEPKLYGSVVTNPKPHMKGAARSAQDNAGVSKVSSTDFPEPPGFLLKEGEEGTDAVSATQQPTAHSVETEDNSRPQKLYVDPTAEPDLVPEPVVQGDSDQAKATSHFSLDAPQSPVDTVGEPQEPQPKRFSRSKRHKPAAQRREEPNFGDDQMRIDFDTSEDIEGFSATDSDDDRSTASKQAPENVEQEVLVLNVRAPEDNLISGAALLPMLLTLGFKFGDQDIFHRHVNSNGKGPVLFSLANMFKPGVFDIDNLENFETQGVSLFMILPIEGDPHQVFNMMHNAARKLADEFGAQVLDGRRSVLTKQGLQQYVEKIREFERKRMIARS
ncbi:hypothetical protein D210916BOD24_14010 [Alteromonas sp. D210916BOD_24]|uniref:cell division protein ZipA n=1 Tax=Alteromonas sp. D210916BOD_24 TaxID=3157618 RepID=UPI00399CFF61